MKRNRIKNVLKALLIVFMGFSSLVIKSQGPGDPPPPPSGHGNDYNYQNGGGAPLGSGLFFMMTTLICYGFIKRYNSLYKKKNSI